MSAGMTLRRRWALNSSISVTLGGSLRSCDQPVPRGANVGKQLHGLRGYAMRGPRIHAEPSATDGRIAQEGDVVTAMRRVDRGCKTGLLGNQARDRKALAVRELCDRGPGCRGGLS